MQEWSPQARGRALDLDADLVLKDPTAALRDVLHVVPGWDRDSAQGVQVEQISGAMTNLVYRCHSSSAAENNTVIVRVFGRGGKLFSQQKERAIFIRASSLGLGPKCLVEFASGRVEQYLPGENLSAESMREPAVAAAIARAMAAFHIQMLADPPAVQQAQQGAEQGQQQQPRPAIWGRIRNWHEVAQELAPKEVAALGLSSALEETARLEAALSQRFPLWLGFSHNDLQYGNMLLFRTAAAQQAQHAGQQQQPAAPEPAGPTWAVANSHQGGQAPQQAQQGQQDNGFYIRLIDYEYSTLNDVAYDVANHWCEYTYNYHSDQPHALDWSKFPTAQEQQAFCAAYVAALQQQQQQQQQAAQQAQQQQQPGDGSSSSSAAAAGVAGREAGWALAESILGPAAAAGDPAAAEAVVGLLVEKALAYATLAHLKWSLWGLIQDKMSDCDFDYMEYSRQRVRCYHDAKAAYL